MDDLMDMIAGDESPSQISDAIKNLLFAKSAENIDAVRPEVAASLFGEQEYDEQEDSQDYDESDDYEEDQDEEEF